MVAVASTPSIRTRPPVGSSKPAMILKIVLLPHPDGPIRLAKRPCGMETVMGASAAKAPAGVRNVMLTLSTWSFGTEKDMRIPADGAIRNSRNYNAKVMPSAMAVVARRAALLRAEDTLRACEIDRHCAVLFHCGALHIIAPIAHLPLIPG